MSELTVDQAIQLALQHRQAGQLAEAEEIFRQILNVYPDQADALHLLGETYLQAKRPDLAESRIREAIAARAEPAFMLTLGVVLQSGQRHEEAVGLYQKLIGAHPDFVEGYVHLGVVLSILGRFEEAAREFQSALRLSPSHVTAQGNLGIVLCHLQRFDEAVWVLRAAIAQSPKVSDFHASLAAALLASGQLEAALLAGKEAAALNPQNAQAQNVLSLVLRAMGKHKEAVEPARVAAALLSDVAQVQVNLGETLRQAQMTDHAAEHYRRALERLKDSADLHNNLGNVLKDQGSLDEAIAEYRASFEIESNPAVFSNMLYAMHYHPGYAPAAIYAELQRCNALFAEPLKGHIPRHNNLRDPSKRLKIGYISTEFRQHALGLNLVPLFSRHDRSQFEIFCYAEVDKPDFYTYRIRQCADHWEEMRGKKDGDIAGLVRRDGIDILIDLHQHMAGNRLMVYARKPAPVQIAFAGYPGSTGLTAIDFRLTDPYLEPPGAAPQPSSETPLRLPKSFWCYHPVVEVPVNELPALKNGYVTFGNLNNFCKLNEGTYLLWARIMRAVEKSRLLLLAPEGSHRARAKAYLEKEGISPDRVEFLNRASAAEYYQYYHRIDISIDSFPCNGHTTSMDSFWMGVPVASIEGDRLFGRATWSQASNLGLRELVGRDGEAFVALSIALAKDTERLRGMRRTLRDRMRASPLMDEAGFAAGIEAAYREAWVSWCTKGEGAGN